MAKEQPQRPYPLFSACGLNCGLCPRFHTEGTSRCPGCGGEGFATFRPTCGIISCCQRHGGLAYCFECTEYPCTKYEKAHCVDSFISHKNMREDAARAKDIGMDAYRAELDEKVAILQRLLSSYNDGRRKSFYCTAVNLLPLPVIRDVMVQVEADAASIAAPKEKAAIAAGCFQAAADRLGISLKLRKK